MAATDPNAANVKKWGAMSAPYSTWMQKWSLPLAATLVTQLQTLTPVERGQEVPAGLVDVGCGPGVASVHAAAHIPKEWSIHAYDLSPEMVQRAKAAFKDLGVSRAMTAAVSPADTIPLEDKSVGGIVSNLCYMLVPDADAAFLEARRVLAPGGVLAFSVWGRPQHSPLFQDVASVLATTVEAFPDPTTPARSNFDLGKDRAALVARVKAAGFASVTSWHVPAALPVTSPAAAAAFRWSLTLIPGTFTPVEEVATPEEKAAALAGLEALYAPALEAGDPIALDCVVVVAQ